jgi:hypothetical protein
MNKDLTPNIDNIDLNGCNVDLQFGSSITLTVTKNGKEIVEQYDPKGIAEIRKRFNKCSVNYIEDRIKVFVDTLNVIK